MNMPVKEGKKPEPFLVLTTIVWKDGTISSRVVNWRNPVAVKKFTTVSAEALHKFGTVTTKRITVSESMAIKQKEERRW